MPNKLITFIGTGSIVDWEKEIHEREYRTAIYTIDGEKYESSFVADALYDHYKVDHLFIIGTVRSMWEEAYSIFCKKFNIPIDDEYSLNLAVTSSESNNETELDSLNLDPFRKTFEGKITPVVIPYGLNREEQLTIFNKLVSILKQVDKTDQLYLDITHAFRSLPLIAQSAIQYAQEVMDTPLSVRVTYGMLDIARELGEAPIVDVSLVSELSEWTKAAHSFKDYGKGYLLVDLIGKENQELAKKIKDFSDVVGINYINDIRSMLTNLSDIYKKEEQTIKSDMAKLVIPDVIENFVSKLQRAGSKSQAHFQYELADWHYKNKNYAMAYLVFVEAMVTYQCDYSGYKWSVKSNREKAKIELSKRDDLKNMYKVVNKLRIGIAHSTKTQKSSGIKRDIESFKEFQKIFKNVMDD